MKNIKNLTVLLLSLIIILSCTETAFAYQGDGTYTRSVGSPSQGRVFQLTTWWSYDNFKQVSMTVNHVYGDSQWLSLEASTSAQRTKSDSGSAGIGATVGPEYAQVSVSLGYEAGVSDSVSYTASSACGWNLDNKSSGLYAIGIVFPKKKAKFYIYDYSTKYSSPKVRVNKTITLCWTQPYVDLRKVS